MGEKDITEKLLEDYNDVFADICNVLLFKGKRVIADSELTNAQTHSLYKADEIGEEVNHNKPTYFREQERDVAKYWKKGNVTLSMLGMGNQTDVDKDMALRVIGYDGASYRNQLSSVKQNGKYVRNANTRYPVITMILYFGEGEWTAPTNLKNCLNIPDELNEYVFDYGYHVFNIRRLTRQQVDMFQSDFRVVADYFYQLEHTKDYVPDDQELKHAEAIMQLLTAITHDVRYENSYESARQKGKVYKMEQMLDRLGRRYWSKGVSDGKEEGEAATIVKMIDALCKSMNYSPEDACKATGITKEDYLEAKEQLKNPKTFTVTMKL